MMQVHPASCCALAPGDWTVEQDDGLLLLTAPGGGAELLITAYACGAIPTLSDILALAHKRAPAGAVFDQVECGPFAGFMWERVDDEGVFHREWLLSLAEIALLATCSCSSQQKTPCLDAADRILASLRDARP